MPTEKSDTKINIVNSKYPLTFKDNTPATQTKRRNFLVNTSVSLSIYIITFVIWHFIKHNHIILEELNPVLLFYYILSIFIASILSNKAFLTRKHEYLQSLRKIYISIFLALGILSLIILKGDSSDISRYIIIGSMLTGSVFESLYFYIVSENKSVKKIVNRIPVSLKYMFTDLVLISIAVYFLVIERINFENLNEKHLLTIFLIFVSWVIAALFTHKFNPIKQSVNNWAAAGLHIKFYLLIISSTSLIVFTLNIKNEYWQYFVQSVSVYSTVSFILFLFLYVRKLPYATDEVTTTFLKAFELGKPAISPKKSDYIGKFRFISSEPHEPIVIQKFQFQYFYNFPGVFNFIERELDLKSFDSGKTIITRSTDNYNIMVLEKASTELLINFHEINDLRRINDYFRLLNEKMVKNGIYIGCFIPLKNRYKIFQKKYPFLITSIFYFFDFMWRRIFPKLPVLQKAYFNLTKGRDRAISLAEGLGRLVYCGFEIVDLTEIDEYVYFVAKKVKEPSTDRNPSYSPIFKMKRIGENGKQIFVYKIRTMHPYSEYLQEFVYNKNRLSAGGKFKDDFRISDWGKILRKLWIDELPMLINLFRGELKLVGIRPVSHHYLSLYSPEFQERRKKYKPGLVPPFYADMPKTIEEIEESEKKYLNLFDSSPLKTDIKYFFKIFFNILFHKKTSA